MLIEVKSETIEMVEVKTPCYYKTKNAFHFINDQGVLISVRNGQITSWYPETPFYNSSIKEVIKEGALSEADEFDAAFVKTINSLLIQADKVGQI